MKNGEQYKSRFEIAQIYLYKLNDYHKALESYKLVLKDYTKCEVSAKVQKSIGYIYSLLKQYSKAHEEYEKVWKFYPTYKSEVAKAFYENGELYFKEYFYSSNRSLNKEKLKKALSNYKLAYLYCPLEEEEVLEWTVEAIIKAFKFLDGNMKRANAFIRYQRYKKFNDKGKMSSKDGDIYNPLEDF